MLSRSLQRKPGSADNLTFDFWFRNCKGISSMSLQGPEVWSFVRQPWGTKTPQFLLWKLPGLTTSLWSLATVSSSVERSRLRPAGGALPILTGSFWNGGGEQRKGKTLLRGPRHMCVFSHRPPRPTLPSPAGGRAGTCVTVTNGTERETEAQGSGVFS